MLRPFELHTPDSLVRASSLLKERGDDATVYAGGTELLLVMKAGFVQYQDLVDVKLLPELRGVRHDAASERWSSVLRQPIGKLNCPLS